MFGKSLKCLAALSLVLALLSGACFAEEPHIPFLDWLIQMIENARPADAVETDSTGSIWDKRVSYTETALPDRAFAQGGRLCAGMTADGMYTTFAESFRNHMLEKNRPMFPFFQLCMLWIRLVSGANVVTDGPIRRIHALRRPILMIQSRQDIYSLPEKAEELYAACGSPKKQLSWFDKGGHSRVRCNAPEQYDQAIKDFLATLES